MSTRGAIARLTDNGWRGVYTHNDSYPTGQGRAVWNSIHQQFDGNADEFLRYAVDEHSRGWSCFEEDRPYGEDQREAWVYETDGGCGESCNPLSIEWVYAIDPEDRLLAVFRSRGVEHRHIETYSLDGPEPDWERLEDISGAVS